VKWSVVLFCLLGAVSMLASPVPQIGDVLQHDDAYEISVIYSEPVDQFSLQDPGNYSVAPGDVFTLRLCATNQGVVLTVIGIGAGTQGFVNISGVMDTAGNVLPPASLEFKTTPRFWTVIGENELGFRPDAFGIVADGYDIFSGSLQQSGDYDDATFVGEKVTGDFEAKTRVEYVEPAGRGAKAGIMVREHIDAGKLRPADPSDPAESFARYVELAIAAPVSALGEASGGKHEIWERPTFPGDTTISVTLTNDAAPAFTNAWLRVERIGQQFLMSRSVNGKVWERMGSATFAEPLPDDLYVGVAFSPQNDDLPAGKRKAFLAKFRDLSIQSANGGHLKITRVGDHAEVSWDEGWNLETAPAVTGAWSNAPSQVSPLPVNFSETMRFYRLRRVAP
jgi:hypothetical protein